jgi:alpha-tubulin suppressor-like RCC1 family protein
VKIVSGNRHCLAISDKGNLFGWGFNSMQQLSHSAEYQDPDNPSHAIFEPTLMSGELKGKFVVDAAAGEEHTVVVC